MASETVYIVIIEDRHIDVDTQPYRDRDTALTEARRLAGEYARTAADVQEITPAMADDQWIYFATYGGEDDCVRVVQRELL